MKRIDSLVTPKLWQFYRPRFFMFLLTMVVLGLMVSAKAHGNYMLLISMAVIEISIATALLATCNCFWKKISSNI
jgi:hypothetical protein